MQARSAGTWAARRTPFGPELKPVTNGLGFLPYGNGVHYDNEEQRRPLLHRLVADGTLPTSFATDDGIGVLYEGTEPVAVSRTSPDTTSAAYRIERSDTGGGGRGTRCRDPTADWTGSLISGPA